MKIKVREKEDYIIVDLESIANSFQEAQEFHQRFETLLNSGKSLFVINLLNVVYLNSITVGMISSSFNSTRKKNGRFVLINVDEKLEEFLDGVGLKRHIKTYASESEFERQELKAK